jgi:hypothetical protein
MASLSERECRSTNKMEWPMKRITQNQCGSSRDNFVALFRFCKFTKEPRKLGCFIILSFALCGTAQVGRAREISPADDYCREINDPSSGTDVVLKPGAYRGACKVRRGGKPGFPLVIRGLSPTHRSRIEYEGKNGNVLEIYADNILIQGLKFGPTSSDVDGVRIFSGDNVTVADCLFVQMGGIAVVANHASIKGLIVRRNIITQSASTGMYFGCHDGSSCTVSQLLIEKNFMSGVNARESEIGYGIQLKLNSFGIVRDNVIVNTKGPGIMIYGAKDLSQISTIERNFVAGSQESSGIVIGGGPAIVRNNISVGNSEGGIGLEDYGRRALLRKIVVTYNSFYNNRRGGVLAPTEGPLEAEISANAVASREGTPLFPAERERLRVFGNQDCRNANCFVDPINNDFTPMNGSALFTVGNNGTLLPTPPDDYFGHIRPAVSVIGAIEPPGGSVTMGIKD